MGHDGNAALGQVLNSLGHPRAAFQFDGRGAGFLDDAGGIAERDRRAFFVRAERHVHRDQRAGRAAHDRLGVGDHHVQRHAQRAFQPVHHHAQTVADENEVDMFVEQLGGVRVIAGETDNRLGAFVGADLRHCDALDLGLHRHEAVSTGRTIIP